MAVVKVGRRNEVIIPKRVRDELGLKPGDYVEMSIRRLPATREPIGPKTRASIEAGLEDIEQGRFGPPLRSRKEIRAHLARLKKK